MKTDLEVQMEAVMGELNTEMQAQARQHIEFLIGGQINSFEALIAAVQDRKSEIEVRRTACWALGQLRDKRAVKGLLVAFEDEDLSLCWEASKSLGIIGSKRSTRPLVRTLSEGRSHQVRAAAAYALGFVADKRAVEPLLQVLLNREEDVLVRGHASEALALLRDDRAVKPLIDCLNDESPEVRFWSAYALGQLEDARALPALQDLKAKDHTVLPGWGRISDEAADAIEQIVKPL